MLKKSLIATAAISATLLAAATLLLTQAQSRSTAPAGITTTSAQASAGAPEFDTKSRVRAISSPRRQCNQQVSAAAPVFL